ncbi:MAG: helix-turn-helix transcriptional regulator [Myxococcales bacterium]|nr:helix-turn-helix transcriptional regulator [Myxococcales bacterium]
MTAIDPRVYHRLSRARDRLHQDPAEPWTTESLAREAALSPWHFLREFRRAFGQTPGRYLTRVRLEAARHLIVTADATVTEACMAVGFSSLGSFSAAFHREMGIPPGELARTRRALVAVPGALPRVYVPWCFFLAYAAAPAATAEQQSARSGPLPRAAPCARVDSPTP